MYTYTHTYAHTYIYIIACILTYIHSHTHIHTPHIYIIYTCNLYINIYVYILYINIFMQANRYDLPHFIIPFAKMSFFHVYFYLCDF